MRDLKKYKVSIVETSERIVEVYAASAYDAWEAVSQGWSNGDYILDSSDFQDVDFRVHSRIRPEDGEEDYLTSIPDFETYGDF